MQTDVLELKSQNITESALETAKLLHISPLFYVRTSHKPEELVEAISQHTKDTFTWECVARDKEHVTLIFQKKTSCCGMCH